MRPKASCGGYRQRTATPPRSEPRLGHRQQPLCDRQPHHLDLGASSGRVRVLRCTPSHHQTATRVVRPHGGSHDSTVVGARRVPALHRRGRGPCSGTSVGTGPPPTPSPYGPPSRRPGRRRHPCPATIGSARPEARKCVASVVVRHTPTAGTSRSQCGGQLARFAISIEIWPSGLRIYTAAGSGLGPTATAQRPISMDHRMNLTWGTSAQQTRRVSRNLQICSSSAVGREILQRVVRPYNPTVELQRRLTGIAGLL